uniref:ceramide glucosyltransferase n=1 Tax=Aegilops tauschii subsp. strangulata TaxID=200361 RepID=A0A453G348_AEGTS
VKQHTHSSIQRWLAASAAEHIQISHATGDPSSLLFSSSVSYRSPGQRSSERPLRPTRPLRSLPSPPRGPPRSSGTRPPRQKRQGEGNAAAAMAAMEAAADAMLAAASRAFCSSVAVFFQIQGCCICLLLAFGWAVASLVRKKEIRKMRRKMASGHSFAFLCDDVDELEHSVQQKLPMVSVVMPLKGFGEHNLQNWRTQITSLYGGPLEFLFVVESKDDPAYRAVSRLIVEYKDKLDAKVVVAGFSTTCSQKIHNQLIGVEKMHKDSKYVLFLDDDVRLHPGTVGALTKEMEKNPEVCLLWHSPLSCFILLTFLTRHFSCILQIFIQTGYPLDLPSGSLGSYCIYEYHMPCSIGFATGGRTFFLWGGCMMMHADDFRQDLYGLVTALKNGGYSDDMTLAAIAGQHKRLITSPPVAVFPHPLASDLSFSRYCRSYIRNTFTSSSFS